MALKPCKECKKEISTEAKVCPNCGKKNPTATGLPAIVWAGIVVVVIILIGNQASNGPSRPPQTAEQAARAGTAILAAKKAQKAADSINLQLAKAQSICKFAADKSLKSPSTAEYHDDETYFKDLGKGASHIQLQVDAENSFGAKLRSTIDCKTKQTASGDVTLTSFKSWQR